MNIKNFSDVLKEAEKVTSQVDVSTPKKFLENGAELTLLGIEAIALIAGESAKLTARRGAVKILSILENQKKR